MLVAKVHASSRKDWSSGANGGSWQTNLSTAGPPGGAEHQGGAGGVPVEVHAPADRVDQRGDVLDLPIDAYAACPRDPAGHGSRS